MKFTSRDEVFLDSPARMNGAVMAWYLRGSVCTYDILWINSNQMQSDIEEADLLTHNEWLTKYSSSVGAQIVAAQRPMYGNVHVQVPYSGSNRGPYSTTQAAKFALSDSVYEDDILSNLGTIIQVFNRNGNYEYDIYYSAIKATHFHMPESSLLTPSEWLAKYYPVQTKIVTAQVPIPGNIKVQVPRSGSNHGPYSTTQAPKFQVGDTAVGKYNASECIVDTVNWNTGLSTHMYAVTWVSGVPSYRPQKEEDLLTPAEFQALYQQATPIMPPPRFNLGDKCYRTQNAMTGTINATIPPHPHGVAEMNYIVCWSDGSFSRGILDSELLTEQEYLTLIKVGRKGTLQFKNDIDSNQIDEFRTNFYDSIATKKCSCGAHTVGSNNHSNWCDIK